MAISRETIIDRYSDLGDPAQSELGRNGMQSIADAALDFVNTKLRDYVLVPLNIVSGTSEYDLSTSLGIKGILKLFTQGPVDKLLTANLSAIGIESRVFVDAYSNVGISAWGELDLYLIAKKRLMEWQLQETDYQFMFLDNKIVIIPTPTSTTTIAYLGYKPFTWETLPDEWIELLSNTYAHKHLMHLASKRSNVSGIGGDGSSTVYPADKLMKLAKEYKDDRDNEIKTLQVKARLFL